MTIRQQGGVFGRNPTFNNVTVDGTLTVDQIVEKTGAAGIMLDGVTLKDGNVVLADGKGIDFSATPGTGTSELFDDYEEGTFTVSSTRITDLTTNVGRYTKVGNLVTCEINLDWTATDNSGNDVIFTGLPFTTATGTHASIGPALVYGTDINTDVGVAIVLHIDDNQTRFYLVKAIDSSFAPLNAADMNSATTLRSTFTYTAA